MDVLRLALVGLLLLCAPLRAAPPAPPPPAPPAAPPAPEASFRGAARVVAVGDVHGDYDKFVAALRLCRVLDDKANWSGGRTHLVQTGDVLDRGPDSRKVMDLLMRLEAQALRAGGRVHALIGNHEAMNMLGDLRYVSDGELAAFGDPPRGTPGAAQAGDFPHLRAAFAPTGRYGRWILGHNAVINIDGTIFLHGGLSAKYAERDLRALNDTIRGELSSGVEPQSGVVGDPEGPLWYRGLALAGPEEALRAQVEPVLAAQKARRMVMGHSIQEDGIRLSLDGRVALIDVGMSRWTQDRPPACLQIQRTGPRSDKLTILR